VVERYNLLAAAEGANAALTGNALSRYERGVIRWPDPVTRRLLTTVCAGSPGAVGIPFTAEEIAERRLAPSAEACVGLAWEHRGALLR